MPELPEVETIRRDLSKKILGKRIKNIKINKPKIVKGKTLEFKRELINSSVKNINRKGKLLIFVLSREDKFLLVHLKMTGQLIYVDDNKVISGGHNYPKIEKLPNKFSHIIFTLNDKSKLFYNDIRQFGYMKIVNKNDLDEVLLNFGIDPINEIFRKDDLLAMLEKKKTNIKAFLLNQKNVAGIGNIYADEILFDSKIKPNRGVNTLSKKEKDNIYSTIKRILKKAIKYRGTTFSNYVDGRGNKGNFTRLLKVYQKEGEKCVKCKKLIKKIKIAGRGTHYCSNCQK